MIWRVPCKIYSIFFRVVKAPDLGVLKKALLKTSKIILMCTNSLARQFSSMFHAKCLLPRLDELLHVRSCLQNFYQWRCRFNERVSCNTCTRYTSQLICHTCCKGGSTLEKVLIFLTWPRKYLFYQPVQNPILNGICCISKCRPCQIWDLKLHDSVVDTFAATFLPSSHLPSKLYLLIEPREGFLRQISNMD